MSHTQQLHIRGMSCASCAGRIEKALRQVEGVTDASVNLASETASVSGDATAKALAKAVTDAGYHLSLQPQQYVVTGMSCASCAGRVEKALAAVPGVLSADVNLATEQVSLQLLTDIDFHTLQQALANSHYRLVEPEPETANDANATSAKPFYRQDWWPVLGSALLTLPLVLPMLGMLFAANWMLPAFWQWLLATPVQFYFGARFYKAG